MDPSNAQNQQIMSTQSLENMLTNSNNSQQERKLRSKREQALKCPRCDSNNTKFCYYNNYSLSQPRYFCKSCKRYWTKGGTLRNVPVGGGCRKAKRSSSSSSSPSSSSKRAQDQSFPHLTYDSSDTLTLGFQKQSWEQLGFNNHDLSMLGNPTSSSFYHILGKHGMNSTTTNHGLLLDTLRSGFLGTQNNNNGHQNMYCVYGNNGDIGEVDNGNSGMMMMLPYDREMSNVGTQVMRVSAKKQEQSGNRVYTTNIGEVDYSGIASWNNGFTSSWHGLLHSPLI